MTSTSDASARPARTAPGAVRLLPRAVLSGALAAAVALAAAACGTEPAAGDRAGVDADSVRRVLIRGFEQGRAVDRAFIRAIPDSALRWAPTDGVRDFAEQVEHAVLDNLRIVAMGVAEEEPPILGDTAVYLNDREALERAAERSYDYVLTTLRELPASELTAEGQIFGRTLPKWNILLMALQHAEWTRGQLVPYFRIHGIDPPDWRTY